MRRRPWGRRAGIAFILVWSLLPIYWAVNTSLQTDNQVTAKPAHYLPPTPTLHNYRDSAERVGGHPGLDPALHGEHLHRVRCWPR